MKRCSTLILRCAVIAAGLIMLAMDVGITWWAGIIWGRNPAHAAILIVMLIGLYASAIPITVSLVQVMKLLGCVDANYAFSENSVRALKIITRCTGTVFIICSTCGLPFFYYWAKSDDAPGVMLIGLLIAGSVFIITVFASLLKLLWQEAMDAKSENDLTI